MDAVEYMERNGKTFHTYGYLDKHEGEHRSIRPSQENKRDKEEADEE